MTGDIGGYQRALIYTMVLMSAADSDMSDDELKMIGEIIRMLPIFGKFDPAALTRIAGDCAEILQDEDGLDNALELIRDSLPPKMRETAYALACDVAAADGQLAQEELRLLEMIRHTLNIDRLVASAIERGAAARFVRT